MQLNRVRRKVPPTNLTPLIDVVFLLLIFFMLASTFLKFSGTPVSGASSGGESRRAQTFSVRVEPSSPAGRTRRTRIKTRNTRTSTPPE